MTDLPEVISIEEEETEPWPRPHVSRRTLRRVLGAAAAAVVLAAVVLVVAHVLDDPETAAVTPASSARLEVLSKHPLSNLAAERLLERRFLPVPDDDESDVSCSARIARPAHSVRRCQVRYPGGTERRVVLITNANGAEMLSER